MDNVIVTPHIASATARMAPETRRRLGREIATVLQGKWPRSAGNPGVLPRTSLIRWQPYPIGRGPDPEAPKGDLVSLPGYFITPEKLPAVWPGDLFDTSFGSWAN